MTTEKPIVSGGVGARGNPGRAAGCMIGPQVGNVVDVAIVLISAMFIIPLRRSFVLVLAGLPTAIIDGLAF
jgi:hypothetical protein